MKWRLWSISIAISVAGILFTSVQSLGTSSRLTPYATLIELRCFPPWTTPAGAQKACCENPKASNCFDEELTRSLCCDHTGNPEFKGDYGGQKSLQDWPVDDEPQWRLDEECGHLSMKPNISPEDLLILAASDPSYLPCKREEPWYNIAGQWITSSIDSQEMVVMDVSHCVWATAACANLTDLASRAVQVRGNQFLMDPSHKALMLFPSIEGAVWDNRREGDKLASPFVEFFPKPILTRRRPSGSDRSDDVRKPDLEGPHKNTPKVDLGKPPVYILSVDSLTRVLLKRGLPKTYQFLKRLAAGFGPPVKPAPADTPPIPTSHELFEFERFHTLSYGGTLSQIFPFLFGGITLPCRSLEPQFWNAAIMLYNITSCVRDCAAFPGGGALGFLRRRAGYRLATSWTDPSFGSIVRDIPWDHVMPHVADVLERLPMNGAVNNVPKRELRRDDQTLPTDIYCSGGGKRLFEHVLEWNTKMLEHYRRRNESFFLYSHLMGGHLEQQRSILLDEGIRDHLVQVVNANPDTIIVFTSDHGSMSPMCSQRMPILHLFVPQSLLNRNPGLRQTLRANSKSVVSYFDLFATLRHIGGDTKPNNRGGFAMLLDRGITLLAASPRQAGQDAHDLDIRDARFNPTSLFDSFPQNRSCTAAGIKPDHCVVRQSSGSSPPVYCAPYDQLSEVTRESMLETEARYARMPLDKDTKVFCEIGWYLVMDASVTINSAKGHYDGNNVCEPLKPVLIESLTVAGEGPQQVFVARFQFEQGTPRRVFDARYQLKHSGDHHTQLWTLGYRQITRYRKYERCTPPGVPAQICVCGES